MMGVVMVIIVEVVMLTPRGCNAISSKRKKFFFLFRRPFCYKPANIFRKRKQGPDRLIGVRL